jgi:hypothetical protein
MKMSNSKLRPALTFILIILGYVGYLVSCTNEDQVIEPAPVVNNETDLVSVKVATPPTIDGTVDALWENSTKLQFSTEVPEVTGDVFRGYTGNIIPSVTLRSVYDAENIYFLAEWTDPTQSFARSPWYFNPTTKKWAQEKGTYDFDPVTGAILRQPFYEDKIAVLWNINNSVSGWNSGTCYKSCHTGLPAVDGSSRHFTNFGTEKIDMWHWKSVRGGVNAGFQIHDQYQDNTYPNGRKGDAGGTDVYTNNTQKLNNGVADVSVPKYVNPTANNSYWILESEFAAGGPAKLVTAVDVDGKLTLEGGTIVDPAVGTDYQRVGAGLGPKAVAGVYLKDAGYGGTQADISCKAVYANAKWTIEIKRKLTTGDALDVDFSDLGEQYFGFAVFENAQIAHSIKTNLVLKFKKD